MSVKRLKNSFLLVLALMAGYTGAHGQKAKYKAELPKTAAADFYVISLTPQVLAKANADMADVRVVGEDGKAVPYLFGDMLPEKNSTQHFTAFKQIVPGNKPDTATTFIVENPAESTSLNQLVLQLRNMDVERTVNLAGSDDLQQWYAIKEDITLQKTGDRSFANGSYQQLLNFPASNYHYLRIMVSNKHRNPVAIIAAGIYSSQMVEKPAYWPLKNIKFSQKDSAKISRIRIVLGDNYRVDQLSPEFTGARYYKRSLRLYEVKNGNRNLLADTLISSADEPLLRFSAKPGLLEMEIDNEDNPPLTLTKVQAGQLQQSLIAYLDGGKNYKLLFGDTAATAPNYDLRFFADSVRDFHELRTLTPGLVKNNGAQSAEISAPKQKLPAWALWAIIVAVLTALGAMTFKMTKEVEKRG